MIKHWIVLALAATPALGLGGVSVFEGTPGGVGAVRTYDEQSGALLASPVALDGIALLPIDFSGRTTLEERLPGRPRLHTDVPGAARIALPNGAGSLYHYRRATAAGPVEFGYLHIAADGVARSLIAIQGTGPLANVDPFLPRVAVASAADAFLAATTFKAGGNLLEVSITGTPQVIDRTANQRPQRFANSSLLLTPTFGVGASSVSLFRFERAPTSLARRLIFEPDLHGALVSTPIEPLVYPRWIPGQVASSANGSWAVTTAGYSPTELHVYAFSARGAAYRFTETAGPVSGAGFLPEAENGPFLAISDDGNRCAWRTEGATHEAFVAKRSPPLGEQPLHVSADSMFPDTLDEIGLFHFRILGSLVFGIGGVGQGGVIEDNDIFEVTLPDAAPAQFTNLSLSSGDASAPFLSIPTIKLTYATLVPGDNGMLYMDEGGPTGRLFLLEPGTPGPRLLLENVKELLGVEVSGQHMLISIRREDGNRPRELYRMPLNASSAPVLVMSLPDTTIYSRFASRGDGWIGFVTSNAGESLQRVDLGTGQLETFNAAPMQFGPCHGLTSAGSLAISTGIAPAPVGVMTWPFDGSAPVAMSTSGGSVFVLP